MDSRRLPERVPDADPPSLVVRGVTPAVDAGRYAVKRLVGDELRVGAHIFKDGHDALAARLLLWPPGERTPESVPSLLRLPRISLVRHNPSRPAGQMAFHGQPLISTVSRSGRTSLEKKVAAAQGFGSNLIKGRDLVRTAEPHARGANHARLLEHRRLVGDAGPYQSARVRAALSPYLLSEMGVYAPLKLFPRPERDFGSGKTTAAGVAPDNNFPQWPRKTSGRHLEEPPPPR